VILRPLLTIMNPLVHHSLVSHPQSDLERFGIHRQTVRHLVTAEAVQDRAIIRLLRRQNLEGDDASEEGCVQFAVRKMGTNTPIDVVISRPIVRVLATDNSLTCGFQRPAHNVAFLA